MGALKSWREGMLLRVRCCARNNGELTIRWDENGDPPGLENDTARETKRVPADTKPHFLSVPILSHWQVGLARKIEEEYRKDRALFSGLFVEVNLLYFLSMASSFWHRTMYPNLLRFPDGDGGVVSGGGEVGGGGAGGEGTDNAAGGRAPGARGENVTSEDNFARDGRVIELDIQRELKESYLTYAMSTIMDRALPDIRDGLKPSQRRILVAMNDLNLRPGRKHLKCSKICGDTSGNYHPHGDAVIYPTLVIMAQKWRMRVPLVDPQGNFGSILGDPPAAMRYTEARMKPSAVDLMADLKLDTVDFHPNYDDRLMEPAVLPGRFPNLLINGGVGIAVGIATSLSPHNPTEVFDSIIRCLEARLESREIGLDDIMRDEVDAQGNITRRGIKGPDFPTGGIVMGRRGIFDAYMHGRGKVSVRGVCHFEEMEKSGRTRIVIDEIPFMLSQGTLFDSIKDAVDNEKITDISYANDESGREAQTRIVLELKKGADPRVVERQLYEFTPLQQTFSMNHIALVNNQPRTLSIIEMIDCYIGHRLDVVRRRTEFLLREAKRKAHELEGMIFAVCDIDEVIREIRASGTREEAIERLMRKQFSIPATHKYMALMPARLVKKLERAQAVGGIMLSRVQAETIGAMRLIQLVGLEMQRLARDYNELIRQIEDFERILGDEKVMLGMVRDDCLEMRARYDSPRRTRIEEGEADIAIAELIPVTDVTVTISRQGYVKRVPADTYRQQNRGGKGISAGDSKEDDFIEHVFVASTHDDLLCFTNTGRVFKMKVFELPEMSRTSQGRNIINLVNLAPGERTCAYLTVKDFEAGSDYLTFVSVGGIVKRTPLKDYRNVGKSGLIAVGLKDDDSLLDVTTTAGKDDILLVTADGMAIRFSEEDARLMGRPAAGVKGIELEDGDKVIGVVAISMDQDVDGDNITRDPSMSLLTITDRGYGKRTPIDEYRVQPEIGKARSQSRGGKGRADIKTGERNGKSVAALFVRASDDVVVITKGGQLVRTAAGDIRECGRGTMGVRVVSLNDNDAVVAAASTPGGVVETPGAEPLPPTV
jgi:DNA gyrase subunit A